MTERTFRYLVTALLIIPLFAFVDVVARPISTSNHDLREIFYLLVSIPIVLLSYAAWFQPQIVQGMFGPFRPEEGFQPHGFSRISRRNWTFIGLGLGVLLICGCQFALGLTVASKFGLLPVLKTPTVEIEATQTVAVATDQTGDLTPTATSTEAALTELPASFENTPTVDSVPTKTQQVLPASGLFAVGDQAQVNGIGVTVLDFFTTDNIITSTASPGNTYLVLEVDIQNLSSETGIPYAPKDFSIQDANGVQYQANSTSMAPALSSGNLPKGGNAHGDITFEVPSTSNGFIAIYNPGELLGGNAPIQIDLGQ